MENAIRQLLEAERTAKAIVEKTKEEIKIAWEEYLREKELKIAEIFKELRKKEEKLLSEAKSEAEKKAEEIISKSRNEAKELRERSLPKVERAILKAIDVFWR